MTKFKKEILKIKNKKKYIFYSGDSFLHCLKIILILTAIVFLKEIN